MRWSRRSIREPARRRGVPGFTVLEMLVSITVFIFLLVFVERLVSSAASVAGAGKNRLDSDDQARLALDRIGQDIAQAVKRRDVDYYIQSGTASGQMYFYSRTPGYLPANASNPSGISLIGYCVSSDAKLMRYGNATQWDGAGTVGMAFLTPGNGADYAPVPSTTLKANLPASSDPAYHVLADDVFRIEFCYQLSDGSYSTRPILSTAPSGWGSGAFYSAMSRAPSPADGAPTYTAGSRWYDTGAGRGYVCLKPLANQAVWKPIGWQDISAVVVAVAALDGTSRARIAQAGKSLTAVAGALPGFQGSVLPVRSWLSIVNGSQLTQSGPQIPRSLASAIRVYQRSFYP